MDQYFGEILVIAIQFSDYKKRIIRIMVGIRDRDSCREYFREFKILPQ
jgi:hypothetical protein